MAGNLPMTLNHTNRYHVLRPRPGPVVRPTEMKGASMKTLKHLTLTLMGVGALLSFAVGQSAAERSVVGAWEGNLVVGQTSLRIWLEVTKDPSGGLTATLLSLDQGASPIPCTAVTLQGDTFSFEVPAINGSYTGRLDRQRQQYRRHLDAGPVPDPHAATATRWCPTTGSHQSRGLHSLPYSSTSSRPLSIGSSNP